MDGHISLNSRTNKPKEITKKKQTNLVGSKQATKKCQIETEKENK